MDEKTLMMLLHLKNMRQGPGSDDATNFALNMAGIDRSKFYRVADIGCGTGAQTMALAASLKGEIVAVDLFEEFLAKLEKSCSGRALSASVSTVVASMDDLPFERDEFDIIWSEGAVYNMGFRKGVNYWKDFIKDGGILAVTELSWITENRPDELADFWNAEYAEMDTVSGKIRILEEAGYMVLGHFILPDNCWLDYYYYPLVESHKDFLSRYGEYDLARRIVETDMQELEFYKKYKNYYGYVFYIARKLKP